MIKNPFTPSLNAMAPQAFVAAFLKFAVNAAFIVAAIFFFFNLIIGGINWIGSGGDKGKLEEARSRVLNAIIGIVVVLSTFMIINFIATVFGVELLNFDLDALKIV